MRLNRIQNGTVKRFQNADDGEINVRHGLYKTFRITDPEPSDSVFIAEIVTSGKVLLSRLDVDRLLYQY